MTTINEAFAAMIKTPAFTDACKWDKKLRVYATRFTDGTLRNGGALEILQRFGYIAEVKAPKTIKDSLA